LNIDMVLARAAGHFEAGELDEAMRCANDVLNEKLDEPKALFLAAMCCLKAGRHGLAHAIFSRVAGLYPDKPQVWNNLGNCYHEIADFNSADQMYRKALKLDPKNAATMNNIALMHLVRCEPDKAIEWADKTLKANPDSRDAPWNRALACLMLGKWEEGWSSFDAALGSKFRREIQYQNEDRWTGEKDRIVAVCPEQGIGDELSFASCIPDLIKDSVKVIVECDHRLAGIFKRSFPEADIYGTRFQNGEDLEWPRKYEIEARVNIGTLPRFYRKRTEDFPGTPYLIPDPLRRIQWRALLDSLGPKLKVGIAWTGGKLNTNAAKRSVTLEALLPILKNDCTFISLQYRDPSGELEAFEETHGIKIHHFAHATETKDYDDTAALVAELDLVISVTTAAIHLAGAIGKEAWVLVPSRPRWFYGLQGDRLPWYKSIEMFRQPGGDWGKPISDVAANLALRCLAS